MTHRFATVLMHLLLTSLFIVWEPVHLAHGQVDEPSFCYPGARRFALTSYFDHHAPDYTADNNLTIYTTEVGLNTNGMPDCYWAGTIQVCGYYTEPDNGGRRVYYDGHPAIDYAFPQNTPVVAAAAGTAYRRSIGSIQVVVIAHGNSYWTKYLHVDGASRVADDSAVVRGQQIALSSNTGPQPMAYHLHFEGHFNGESGPLLDPYGWRGQWFNDPWNQPWGHTESWWRSGDPIPMGYRDQNHTPQGPYQLTGVMEGKWYDLNGGPGSPVSAQASCPTNYGMCQFFERGYLRWDYASVIYYDYPKTLIGRVHYVAARNANTILSIQNLGGAPAQVSVIFMDNGRSVDSRTYKTLASNATWQLNTQLALQDLTSHFMGTADVYSNQPIAYSINYINPLPTVFLPLAVKD